MGYTSQSELTFRLIDKDAFTNFQDDFYRKEFKKRIR